MLASSREHRRMAEVAVEHERPDVDRGRHRRRHRERRDRPDALVEVVGNEEGRVAEPLDLANRVEPRPPVEGLLQVDAEAKSTRVCHRSPNLCESSRPVRDESAASAKSSSSSALA